MHTITRVIKHVDGTEKVVQYDGHKYYRNWYDKNIEKVHEKHTCGICKGSYTYMNRSKHNKSKKHQNFLEKNIYKFIF